MLLISKCSVKYTAQYMICIWCKMKFCVQLCRLNSISTLIRHIRLSKDRSFIRKKLKEDNVHKEKTTFPGATKFVHQAQWAEIFSLC